MSYNIGTITVLSSDAFAITRPELDAAEEEVGEDHPESSVFDPDWQTQCCEEHRGMLFVNHIWWTGEGSGNTWEHFLEKVAPRFLGRADLLVVWEGGDDITGIRIENGEVTEHEVVQALGKEKP